MRFENRLPTFSQPKNRLSISTSSDAVVKESLTTASDVKNYETKLCNFDVIISVGYRAKSKRGVEFRRWATDVLRRYIVDDNAANERRLRQLGQVASVMARIPESLETRQVLDIVRSYTAALDLLDDYDHQRIGRRPQVHWRQHACCCNRDDRRKQVGREGRHGRSGDELSRHGVGGLSGCWPTTRMCCRPSSHFVGLRSRMRGLRCQQVMNRVRGSFARLGGSGRCACYPPIANWASVLRGDSNDHRAH